MTKSACHYVLLEYLRAADLARIVEGYVHRKCILLPIETTVSGRDASITMKRAANGYKLSFMVKTPHLAGQKWDVVGEHQLKDVDANVVAHDVFTPKSWLRMSAAIWDDQRLWVTYRLKFKRAIQKLCKRLCNEYMRYAHELMAEYFLVEASTLDFLYMVSGMNALQYS